MKIRELGLIGGVALLTQLHSTLKYGVLCYFHSTSYYEDEFRPARGARAFHMSHRFEAKLPGSRIDLNEEVKFLVEAMNKVTHIRYGVDLDSTKFDKMKERLTRVKQELARIMGVLKIQPGKTNGDVGKQTIEDINQLIDEMGRVTQMESVQSDEKLKEDISLINKRLNSVMDAVLGDCKEKPTVENDCEEDKKEVKLVEEVKVEECLLPPMKRPSPHDVKRVSCYPRIPKKSKFLCRLIKKLGIKSRCNCTK